MDLKALMQKLEAINTRQTLTESVEKEQTGKKKCPPMSHIKKMCQDGKSVTEICKMHPDCDQKELKQMVADCKETMSKDKKKTNEGIVFTSSIARGLVEEFGYEVEESTLTENPHANDPAKSAAWTALSPEDQKWLGGADPTDPYILARAPNKGKPAAPAPGGAAASPAAPAVDAGATDMSMGQAGDANAAASTAAKPSAADPAQDQYGNNIPISSTQTVTPDKQPAADPKKKQMAPVDPGTIELQKWIASKGYNIGAAGADGRWGKDTQAAVRSFWADYKGGKFKDTPDILDQYTKVLNAAKDTDWTRQQYALTQQAKGGAGAANGGQAAQPAAGAKGPTVAAAQGQAPGNPLNQKPGGQAVSNQSGAETARLARQGTAAPTAPNPKVAELDAKLAGLKKYPQMNAQIIARLEKEKAALGGQAASPAAGGQQSPQQMLAQQQIARSKANAANVAPDGNGSGTLQGGQLGSGTYGMTKEDVVYSEDQSLLRIKSLAGL